MSNITRSLVLGLFGLSMSLLVGCGEIPGEEAALGAERGADTVAMCDPYAVGGNKKCSLDSMGRSAFVECETYPYNLKTGVYQGATPVSGCSLDFMASPGVPYTATCVAVCP